MLEMWFEYSESGISGILVLNILKKEAIVKHVSTQVFDNCKILIWNLSAWNVIWVLRIWNFWDVGTQYFEKKMQLWNMLVLRWMIIAKYQFEIWAFEMWFKHSKCGLSTQNLEFGTQYFQMRQSNAIVSSIKY